jgi:branched-chain amino acid transport system permease protein
VTDFLQLLVSGLSIGAVYALVALGFVVIFRATGVINFAQGSLVVLGAYLLHQFAVRMALPFPLAAVAAVLVTAAVAMLVERLVMRPLVGQPLFASILVTLGLVFVIEQVCAAIWGYDLLLIGDPWGVATVRVGAVTVKLLDLWSIGLTAAVVIAFFLLFRRSTLGIAMRAAASDPEAALAHGISPRTIHALSWALAGGLAVVAAMLAASGPKGVDLTLGLIAFRAFPAMILGGMDSTEGAVVGGLVIGLTEVMAAGYLTPNAPWLGTNFHVVMPYLLMIVILVIRPYGLFGTAEVRRI